MDFDPETCRFVGLNAKALHVAPSGAGVFKSCSSASRPSLPRRCGDLSRRPKAQKPGHFDENLFGSESEQPAAEAGIATGADCKYELVQTEEQLAELSSIELKKQKRFAFDTETDALGPMNSNLVGMSFSWEKATGYYLPVCGPAGSTVLACDRALGGGEADSGRPIDSKSRPQHQVRSAGDAPRGRERSRRRARFDGCGVSWWIRAGSLTASIALPSRCSTSARCPPSS